MRADMPQEEPSRQEKLPKGLREALARAARHEIDVPPAVDEAILDDARLHLRGIRRRRPTIVVLRAAALGLAACAVVAIGLNVLTPTRSKSRHAERALLRAEDRASVVAPEDMDGNGRVDILDAFALARRIERGTDRTEWDFNRDGAIDRDDVDLIAMAAVRLAGSGKEVPR